MSRAQSVEIRNENMESVVEVEVHVGFRRRFSISPSPFTTKGTLPARHPGQLWSLYLYDHLFALSLAQRPTRSTRTGYRSLCDCCSWSYRVAQSLRYSQQPCQTTWDSTPCNARCWPPLYRHYWCSCNTALELRSQLSSASVGLLGLIMPMYISPSRKR